MDSGPTFYGWGGSQIKGSKISSTGPKILYYIPCLGSENPCTKAQGRYWGPILPNLFLWEGRKFVAFWVSAGTPFRFLQEPFSNTSMLPELTQEHITEAGGTLDPKIPCSGVPPYQHIQAPMVHNGQS